MLRRLQKKDNLVFLFLSLLLFSIYREWFSSGLITAGDFWPLHEEQFKDYRIVPYAWNYMVNNGFGGNTLHLLWPHFLLNGPVFFLGKIPGISYELVERLGYLFPLFILMVLSSGVWAKSFFKENVLLQFVSAFILATNTYVLMILTGGQLPVVFSYFLAPLSLLAFIKMCKRPALRESLLFGLTIAIQAGADLRIAYVTLIGTFLYFVFHLIFHSEKKIALVKKYAFSLVIFTLIHSFWIIPIIFQGGGYSLEGVGRSYTSSQAAEFLSFAELEKTVGILHPYWPENIFGKTDFMRIEFLIFPILAFLSIVFVKDRKQFYILFFVLLAIVGSFLSKGAKDPFGEVYLWFFDNFPGFVMFRDSTKFYLLTILSYSVLIPFVLLNLAKLVKRKNLENILLLAFLAFWVFTLKEAFTGQVKGITKQVTMPKEYVELKDLLVQDGSFSRVFWVPQVQRFAYYSDLHPFVNAANFYDKYDPIEIIAELAREDAERKLAENGIRYIVVPNDSEKELYLNDRKYDPSIKTNFEKVLDEKKWKKTKIGNISLYEIEESRSLFTTPEGNSLNYTMINPTSYQFQGNTFIFAQSYDNNWLVAGEEPEKSGSFNLFRDFGDGEKVLTYKTQKLVYAGLVISLLTFFACLAFLFFRRKLK